MLVWKSMWGIVGPHTEVRAYWPSSLGNINTIPRTHGLSINRATLRRLQGGEFLDPISKKQFASRPDGSAEKVFN